MARESWTDERLDDLNGRVDHGFEAVDRRFGDVQREFVALRSEMNAEFAAVRAEMKSEFAAVRAEMRTEFTAVRAEMREIRAEVAATQRLLIQLFIPLIVTLVLGFAGMILALMAQC